MTDVDIVNLALSHLGDEAQVESITPADPTEQATQAARFYPMARDVLLEMHPWSFAVRRSALAVLATNPLADDWGWAYTLPNDCIRPLSAAQAGDSNGYAGWFFGFGEGQQPYVVESASDGSGILYTNIEVPYLRFIFRETNTARYTALFTISLSRLLASYLAGPILKGGTGMKVSQEQFKLFTAEFAKAAAMDANSGKRDLHETHRPEWISGRSTLRRWPYPGDWRNLG